MYGRHDRKVFGIGLSRTGTTSLTEALRMLGFRSVHHPLSILTLIGGKLHLNTAAVRPHDALTDTPVALMYRELDRAFPGSKFILTTRDLDGWLASMRSLNTWSPFFSLFPKVARLTEDLYGTRGLTDEAALRENFLKHHREIRAHFGNRLGDDLLILDLAAGDGWKELCWFLGLPSPGIPFPHHNRMRQTTMRNVADFLRFQY